MTNVTLAQCYLIKAQKRLKILDLLLTEDAYSFVVREAQEVVEQYTVEDARRATKDAQFVVATAQLVIRLDA